MKYTKPLSTTAQHSTTASLEWPRRRPSETSRHRTAKSRLRDGYACYGSRHGARGSHVGRGSGTEAEIAPIRHFSCLDFASACPRDGPQKCSAVLVSHEGAEAHERPERGVALAQQRAHLGLSKPA